MRNRNEGLVSPGVVPARPSSESAPFSRDGFSMPFLPGQIINDKYEIVELIGVGGLGFVVAALHVELGEKVALKFLRPEALTNAEAVGRFSREARASARIRSEHVARVFDVGSLPDGAPFIVMEYLDGEDLGAVLQTRGPLPIQLAVEYVLQACEALAAAHANGVVHRDIKPENLFLNRRAGSADIIKVLDFGISKVPLSRSAFESRHPLVRTTMAMGSPIYMSPEQIRAAQDIDARTDIWSLGCVLYELLTNRLAFDAPSVTQITAVILEQETPSLLDACPAASAGLDAVVRRCLAKNAAQRFEDVGELALALYPYAPSRAHASVERTSSILRHAGISRRGQEMNTLQPDPREGSSGAPLSHEATSTATLETQVTQSLRPSRRWAWPVGLLVLAGAVAGVVVRMTVPPGSPAPARGLEASAAAVSSAPARAELATEPTAKPQPAPAEPMPVEPALVAPAGSAEAPPRGTDRRDVEPAPQVAPSTAAMPAAPSVPPAPEAAATASATSTTPPPETSTTESNPSLPRRRVNAAVAKPKPKPTVVVHPSPSAAEPDIGF
jgi:eukaryotic-like serine/threonine-protein kinase